MAGYSAASWDGNSSIRLDRKSVSGSVLCGGKCWGPKQVGTHLRDQERAASVKSRCQAALRDDRRALVSSASHHIKDPGSKGRVYGTSRSNPGLSAAVLTALVY